MSVSQMNAMAVTSLQMGDHRRAIIMLKRGLAIMKSSLYDAEVPIEQAMNFSGGVSAEVVDVSKAVTVHNAGSNSCDQGGALFEVFPRAFEIPDAVACGPDANTDKNKGKASLVILYNMGLAYHLSGLANGSSQDLKIGLDLYKMALAVVDTCLFGEALLTDELLLLQLLALFNNMGHIHSCYYQEAETRHCMGATRALLESKAFHDAKNRGRGAELFMFFEWNDSLSTYHPFFAFAPAA